MTAMRGTRACPTSISSLVLSVSDICGDLPTEVDLLRARKLDMEMSPDTLESVGVNELFVVVTVDASFTTEQVVVGHIDEIHMLSVVRTVLIVVYLSPSQICDTCVLFRVRELDMEMSPGTLEDVLTKTTRMSATWCTSTSSLLFLFAHLSDFFLDIFFKNSRPIPVNRRCLLHPHFRSHV